MAFLKFGSGRETLQQNLYICSRTRRKNKSSASSLFFAFCSTWFFGALERMVDWMKVLLLHAFGSLTECRSKLGYVPHAK